MSIEVVGWSPGILHLRGQIHYLGSEQNYLLHLPSPPLP